MSNTNRQTWDEHNHRKMWVAYLKSHPGIQINTEALAIEMGATKRALDDQFKALRRDARALEILPLAPSAQNEDESIEEEELNVYQRAKRGLEPLKSRQSRAVAATSRRKDAEKKGTRAPNVPVSASGEEEPTTIKAQRKRPEEDDEEDEDKMGGSDADGLAQTERQAIMA